jgi:hypothetical protein
VAVTPQNFFFDVLEKHDNSKGNLSAISVRENSKNCEHLVGLLQEARASDEKE